MNDISPDIACRTCQIGGHAIDYTCVECCIRCLSSMPDRARAAGHIASMERFNLDDPGFSERLREKWAEFVEKRNSTKGES